MVVVVEWEWGASALFALSMDHHDGEFKFYLNGAQSKVFVLTLPGSLGKYIVFNESLFAFLQ